ncbi:hypothetical protein NC652_034457 [Populus alba x Populus x berolinensis]|nr:hypothetical protein NC652_034457 [Populus alba x Populus x berolinensis]
MSDPKYGYPYPAQGYYQGPPVMAPPQYYAAPPPRREPAFTFIVTALQLCAVAALLTSYYQGPPVMTPPQYYAAPQPRREPGFLEGCFVLLQLCAVAALLTSVAATPPFSNRASYVINVEYSVLMSAVVYCLGTFYSNVPLHPCLVHVDIKNFSFNSLNLINLNWSEIN